MEQGQNKLRYVQDLKERVVMNTEHHGSKVIEDDTEKLKKDFENLMNEVQDVKNNLSSRFACFGLSVGIWLATAFWSLSLFLKN
jgi:hypothetical protein